MIYITKTTGIINRASFEFTKRNLDVYIRCYTEMVSLMHLFPLPSGFGCCPFKRGGSDVVDSLLIVDFIACGVGVCVWSLFCYTVLNVLSSFNNFSYR